MADPEETLARIRAIIPERLSLLSDFLIAAICLAFAGLWMYIGGWKAMPGFALFPTLMGFISLTRFFERLRFRSTLLRILNRDSADIRPIA
jgi:hypothetical protein